MSSMRSRKRPPASRAAWKAVRAENAWPPCRSPVGEGAKRVTNRVLALAPGGLAAARSRRQTHVFEDGAQELLLAAAGRLQRGELLEPGHLGHAVGRAPGRDRAQLQIQLVVRVAARI